MLILIYLASLDLRVYSYRGKMNDNCTFWYHPDENGFPFKSGCSQGLCLLSPQGVFPCHAFLWFPIRDKLKKKKKLYPDVKLLCALITVYYLATLSSAECSTLQGIYEVLIYDVYILPALVCHYDFWQQHLNTESDPEWNEEILQNKAETTTEGFAVHFSERGKFQVHAVRQWVTPESETLEAAVKCTYDWK